MRKYHYDLVHCKRKVKKISSTATVRPEQSKDKIRGSGRSLEKWIYRASLWVYYWVFSEEQRWALLWGLLSGSHITGRGWFMMLFTQTTSENPTTAVWRFCFNYAINCSCISACWTSGDNEISSKIEIKQISWSTGHIFAEVTIKSLQQKTTHRKPLCKKHS